MIRGDRTQILKVHTGGAGGAGNMIRGTEPRFCKYILGGEPRFYKYILVRPIYKDIIPGLSHLHGRRD